MHEEDTMRSELVFRALSHVSNRFLLTRLAAKATRQFHRPSSRIQETMDEVFVHFGHANPIAVVPEASNVQPLRRAEDPKTKLRYTNEDRSAA
jgi:hypothetical protein